MPGQPYLAPILAMTLLQFGCTQVSTQETTAEAAQVTTDLNQQAVAKRTSDVLHDDRCGESGVEHYKERKTPPLRNNVYAKLAQAQSAAEAKDLMTADKILDDLIAVGPGIALNSYELANIYNLKAYLYYAGEDYGDALAAYKSVVAQPNIPLAMEINTRFTIAQLYFVQKHWQPGICALLEWFSMSDAPPANAYVLLAQGYFQTKDYDKALPNIEKAINMFEKDGKTPKEQWYNLARFLYFEKGDIENTSKTLEALIEHYPKDEYRNLLQSLGEPG